MQHSQWKYSIHINEKGLRPQKKDYQVNPTQESVVPKSEIYFATFKRGHIAANQVYFLQVHSEKSSSLVMVTLVAFATKF